MQNQVKLRILALLLNSALCNCRSDAETKRNAIEITAADSVKDPAAAETDAASRTKIVTDWLLTPGVAAGNTRINSDAERVFERLGPPDGGDAAMMKAVAFWYSRHDSTAHSTAIYTARDTGNAPVARVKLIRVTSPAFKTPQGIHPGVSLADIQETYNKLSKIETYQDAGKIYTVYDSPEGITFEISPAEKCVAIVIHEPGKPVAGLYAKFSLTNTHHL